MGSRLSPPSAGVREPSVKNSPFPRLGNARAARKKRHRKREGGREPSFPSPRAFAVGRGRAFRKICKNKTPVTLLFWRKNDRAHKAHYENCGLRLGQETLIAVPRNPHVLRALRLGASKIIG